MLVMYKCALCANACCEYRLRLMTGWTQGHGAAVASPLLTYSFEHLPSSIQFKKQTEMYYCIMI